MKDNDEKGDPTLVDYRYESRVRIGIEIERRVNIELKLFELLSRTQEFQRLKEVMEKHARMFEKSISRLQNEFTIAEARKNEVIESEKLGIENEDLHKSLEEIELKRNKRHIM